MGIKSLESATNVLGSIPTFKWNSTRRKNLRAPGNRVKGSQSSNVRYRKSRMTEVGRKRQFDLPPATAAVCLVADARPGHLYIMMDVSAR